MLRRLFFMFGIVYSTSSFLNAELYVPGSASVPPTSQPVFNWSRGDANSFYSGWDVFADDLPGGNINDNTPQFGSGGASLTETSGTAFITSGGNIYSFAAPTAFTVSVPSIDLGPAAFSTRIVAQFRTQGTELDYADIKLNGASANLSYLSPPVPLGGFGGSLVDYLAVWDLTSVNGPLTLTFNAAGSSMSLDQLHIDGFSSVAAVPEPSSMLLMAAAASGVGYRKWRKRKAVSVA